ncbi:MAG TPA: hypothetical protein VGF63_12605 [Solirubrobacteraceae bacterium]
MAAPDPTRKPKPWESEDAAFALLLRVLAGAVVVVVLVLIVKALT